MLNYFPKLVRVVVGGLPLLTAGVFANGFTIDPDSTTGNYHGTLTVDSTAAVHFGFTDLPSGASADVNLLGLSEFPGELYWYGGAGFQSPGGTANDVLGGGGGGGFLPGQPTSNDNNHDTKTLAYGGWDGVSPYYTEGSVTFGYGFAVSWDGEILSGAGTWSIGWTEQKYWVGTHTPYVAVPDATSTIGSIGGTFALMSVLATWRRKTRR